MKSSVISQISNSFEYLRTYTSSYFYYLFIFFISTYYSLRTSVLQDYPISLLLMMAAISFMLKIITTRYSKKELIYVTMLLILGLINTYFSKSTLALIVICVIVGTKNIKINTVLKIILYTKIIISFLLCIGSLFSVVDNVEVIHNRLGDSVERQSLGYEHPNVFGKILFQCILLYLVIYKDKFIKYDCLIILLLNFICFILTKNRTSFLMIIIIVLCLLFIRKVKFRVKLPIYNIILYLPLILLSVSYIIPKYMYSFLNQNSFFRAIDSLLQYRITFSHIYLYRFNIELFGQRLHNYWSDGYAFLDSGYLNLLLGAGIIITILFLIGYYKLTRKMIKEKREYVLLSIFCILIYGITENIIYSFFYNFIFIYFGLIIFKSKPLKENPKILVINTVNMGFNGISNVIMSHYRYQKKLGWKFSFICNYYIEDTFKEEIISNNDSYLVLNKKKALLNYIYKIGRLLIRTHYDIIHIHGNSSLMILESTISHLNKAKIIVHCHNTNVTSPIAEKCLNKIFKRTYDVALACSKTAGDWLFGTNNYDILNNGIYGENFFFREDVREKIRTELNLNNKKVILQVGRLNNQKNHKFFIEVLNELIKMDSSYFYLIVGDGQLRYDLATLINKYELDKNVMFVGESNDISQYYSASDIFVLPSIYEGLGIVLIEAQCNGLPCVASQNVPKEADFTETVKYAELTVSKWIEEINNIKIERNNKAKDYFYNSKYNFTNSAEHLVKIYNHLLDKQK